MPHRRVGVGFSYADYGQEVGTTEDAAKDVAAFIILFFETFAEFKGRAFHMSGESYGVSVLLKGPTPDSRANLLNMLRLGPIPARVCLGGVRQQCSCQS